MPKPHFPSAKVHPRHAKPSKDSKSLAPPAKENGFRYTNRELSWLDFAAHVIDLATNPATPLLERVKFLAIASQHLDEFFQIRVAGLHEQLALGAHPPPDHMGVPDQLEAIHSRVSTLVVEQSRIIHELLLPELKESGITLVSPSDLTKKERLWVEEFFNNSVFPVLTPLAVDPSHPFPYISSLSHNLAVLLNDHHDKSLRFARVKVPSVLPPLVPLPDPTRFIQLADVISRQLPSLFPGKHIVSVHHFRITRNADLDLATEEAEDLLLAIESQVHSRGVFADVVRLEVDSHISTQVLTMLKEELELGDSDVFTTPQLIDTPTLFALASLDRSDLKDKPWRGATPKAFLSEQPADLFAAIRDQDILVHHPYDSFAATVGAFIAKAAVDPAVLVIKQTLYRTSTKSTIVDALIQAASSGKEVVALVELQARFDEMANILWARKLEQAGVHVVFGVIGLKTHAKLCLVVRRETDSIRQYVHVGTGNYNTSTASTYEDLGLFSADKALCADVSDLFNHLTGYSDQSDWRRLLVAPSGLRSGLLGLINQEAHPEGRITIKLNSLVDPELVDALYTASQAGAKVDLIVRSNCSLRPEVPGLSDNIRVRSLVGRLLEHSRIFRFGKDKSACYYIGSADLMNRNLDRRVEALVPIQAPLLRKRLDEILSLLLNDTELAWVLHDQTWSRPKGPPLNAQSALYELAKTR